MSAGTIPRKDCSQVPSKWSKRESWSWQEEHPGLSLAESTSSTFFENWIMSNLPASSPFSRLGKGSDRYLQSFPPFLHSAGFVSMGERWRAPCCSYRGRRPPSPGLRRASKARYTNHQLSSGTTQWKPADTMIRTLEPRLESKYTCNDVASSKDGMNPLPSFFLQRSIAWMTPISREKATR